MSMSSIGMSWMHNNHIRYELQMYCIFLLFECKLFSFNLLSNISLSNVLIGHMDVIYEGLDIFSFAYML
jgi:hypothetical protein